MPALTKDKRVHSPNLKLSSTLHYIQITLQIFTEEPGFTAE